MGKYDSSKTRVQPVFGRLLERDPTGARWLRDLLRTAPFAGRLGDDVLRAPGLLAAGGLTRFEYPAPPSESFLRWLIEHPQWMTWPVRGGIELKYGEESQSRGKGFSGGSGQRSKPQHSVRGSRSSTSLEHLVRH